MQKMKKRGIILFIIFIAIASVSVFCFSFFGKEKEYKGYFVQEAQRGEVSYGYLY